MEHMSGDATGMIKMVQNGDIIVYYAQFGLVTIFILATHELCYGNNKQWCFVGGSMF